MTTTTDWLLSEASTLTPTECAIVEMLAEREGQWVSLRHLAQRVKGDYFVPELFGHDAHSVRTHISRIRRKLEPTRWRIQNRYFFGLYRLTTSDQ